jgi:hypothetical protein
MPRFKITPDLEVYDTPSGLGGKHTVAITKPLDADRVLVRVCYGRFDDAGRWEAWKDWDGYSFAVERGKLSNPRPLGQRRHTTALI